MSNTLHDLLLATSENIDFNDHFTLTSVQDGSTVMLHSNDGTAQASALYRLNKNDAFQPYTMETEITLNEGEYVQFTDLDNNTNVGQQYHDKYVNFVMTGFFTSSGTVYNITKSKEGALYGLFANCSSLLTRTKCLYDKTEVIFHFVVCFIIVQIWFLLEIFYIMEHGN